jgi:hypothetical protein
MNGVGDGLFSPESGLTRAELVMVLARMSGADTTAAATEKWYDKAWLWARGQGITDGTNPEDRITREQLATMLFRYAGNPASSGSLAAFNDAAAISDWATDALIWASANGIIQGMDGGANPQGGATRAQIAAILQRYLEN